MAKIPGADSPGDLNELFFQALCNHLGVLNTHAKLKDKFKERFETVLTDGLIADPRRIESMLQRAPELKSVLLNSPRLQEAMQSHMPFVLAALRQELNQPQTLIATPEHTIIEWVFQLQEVKNNYNALVDRYNRLREKKGTGPSLGRKIAVTASAGLLGFFGGTEYGKPDPQVVQDEAMISRFREKKLGEYEKQLDEARGKGVFTGSIRAILGKPVEEVAVSPGPLGERLTGTVSALDGAQPGDQSLEIVWKLQVDGKSAQRRFTVELPVTIEKMRTAGNRYFNPVTGAAARESDPYAVKLSNFDDLSLAGMAYKLKNNIKTQLIGGSTKELDALYAEANLDTRKFYDPVIKDRYASYKTIATLTGEYGTQESQRYSEALYREMMQALELDSKGKYKLTDQWLKVQEALKLSPKRALELLDVMRKDVAAYEKDIGNTTFDPNKKYPIDRSMLDDDLKRMLPDPLPIRGYQMERLIEDVKRWAELKELSKANNTGRPR